LRARAFLIDDIEDVGRAADPVSVRPGDVALIQYSSGSTSDPKGVVLTHRNILANARGASEAAGFSDRDVSVSWMPLTHDMGLIGFSSYSRTGCSSTDAEIVHPPAAAVDDVPVAQEGHIEQLAQFRVSPLPEGAGRSSARGH
jgi:acyl-CoA synthetase (AMP-forming)/AMP-acid ligase II